MDIDPIQERTNSINKLIKWAKSLFRKKKSPDYEKTLLEVQKNAKANYEAYSKFGMSCEEAAKAMSKYGEAIAKFNEYKTPNQMRKELGFDEVHDDCILYADDKAYCIIRKGEPIWLEKTK